MLYVVQTNVLGGVGDICWNYFFTVLVLQFSNSLSHLTIAPIQVPSYAVSKHII